MGIRSWLRSILGYPEIPHGKMASFARSMEHRDIPRRSTGDAHTLAIVVPCFRHERYLEKTFSCIINQTRKPDHVVFINDASPDATGRILEALTGASDLTGEIDFRILTNKVNIGQSMSINRGIAEVSDDLVMVLNDDDYLMHDAVEIVIDIFNRHQDLFLIGSSHIAFASDEELAAGTKTIKGILLGDSVPLIRHNPEDVGSYRNYNDLNMTHSGSSFLRVAWQAVGGYLPKGRKRVVPYSDRDFQLRINALFPVAVTQEIPFVYWRNNSSVDNGINS